MATLIRKTFSLTYILSVLFYVQMCIVQVANFSYDETRNVHEAILNFYANEGKQLKNLKPMEEQSMSINVLLTLHLYSIDEFDAHTGKMELTGSLFAEWRDETLATSIGNYSLNAREGHTVFLPPDAVWTPNIRLDNAVIIHEPSYKSYLLRYNVYDGRLIWQPKFKMTVTCKPDVTHFPFDIHDCDINFSPHGYINDDIQIESTQPDFDLCDFTPNGLWELLKVETETIIVNYKSTIKFSFRIERKSLFTIVNNILPISLIAILSSFSFLLPSDSAGRIQLSTACFLSFVFLLRTIVQSLPQSADPVSPFCYFVLSMVTINACVVIVTILIIRLYHGTPSQSVPAYMMKLTRFIKCITFKDHCHNKKNTNTMDYNITAPGASTSNKPADNLPKAAEFSNIRPFTRMTLASRMSVSTYASSTKDNFTTNTDCNNEITWSDVARAMDRLFFILLVTCQCLISFVFTLSLALTSD